MSLYKDPKGATWYASITIGGRRIRRSTGTADKREAQRIHDQLAVDLRRKVDAGYTWHDACIDWLNATPRGASDRYRLRALGIGNVPLHHLTAAMIEPHLSKVPASRNRQANLVAAILNLARRRGHLDAVPHIERGKITPARIRWLALDEWQRLDAQLPAHLKPLVRFSLATGLRQHNATHLEWSQVDLPRKVAWIHADQAKAGKPIGVPLSDDAIAALQGQIGRHKRWVFPYKGKPLQQIKGAWHKALQRAGVDDFRWHDLRHTWATWHVMSGTPLEVLQKLGGWADYSMVLRYAHLAPDHLAGYANNARPYVAENRNSALPTKSECG